MEQEILAQIVKREDGYHVIDKDGTEGPVCEKITPDGYLTLSKNAANRKYYNFKNLEKHFSESDEPIGLCYKESKHFGPVSAKLPKIFTYLSEEEQAEVKAILDRAYAAKASTQKKPMTEKEKLEKQIAKAKEKLAKLLAETAGADETAAD